MKADSWNLGSMGGRAGCGSRPLTHWAIRCPGKLILHCTTKYKYKEYTSLTLHHQIQIQNKIAISNSLPKANTKTFTLNILLPRQIHLTLQMHKYEYKAQSDTGAGAGDVSLSQRKPASSWANWNYQRWSQNISTGVKTAFWMLSVKINNRWRLDFEPNIALW